ncbi:conserved hypothetical protein [Neospora caninum Liverpool]|uniref:Uncharacterized protein n=1 Tax=Neospora caninum (strain Liverpool) TaxID=572307 RepID=F0VLB0_NEOCL|nr:conserved hypothetical protein [Neospora caninum Liverpool]CBZ54862.1 conserved hypothetical protein [Neospora caninum Liverpool]CEL69582.1 TPA: hypothetical protein BN1204_052870 [Neospora caninum Liverpool]|eukprot:XP_003884890.1 conserved hypothetical protein [Neospora caninum Liverpool]
MSLFGSSPGRSSDSDDDRSLRSPSRASSAGLSDPEDAQRSAGNEREDASSLREEAAKFLWGGSEDEKEDEGENDLLDADDYIQASSSSAAKLTAQPGFSADGEDETFDEEVPYAPRLLLKDAEARSRKEKLLFAAFNSLTHTEVLLSHAADLATHVSRVHTAGQGSEGASLQAVPRLSDEHRRRRSLSAAPHAPRLSLSSRKSWEAEQDAEKRPVIGRPSRSPRSSQTLDQASRPPAFSEAHSDASAQPHPLRASFSSRSSSASGGETGKAPAAGQLAPKMMKVMREIFGKRKPVGRFGGYGQLAAGRRDGHAAKPNAAAASQAGYPTPSPPPATSDPVAQKPLASPPVLAQAGQKVSVTVTDEAVRQLKDINLLLKREGCAGSLRRQRAQELYDFEDGHMLYQHPRFCATAIFRENLVARRLAPLWTAIAARYDAVEGSDDAQQIEQQQHLLVQLLRCLAFLAAAPPLDWIQYWMKFAPWLDDLKRTDDFRKKEKKRIEELRARRRRLGLPPSEAEKETEEKFFRDEELHRDPPVQEERRLRSHIIMKYYRGMQDAKKALCCPALWQLLASVFVDKQDFVDRGGRTAEQQRRLDGLAAEREALYKREKEMKSRLRELEEENAQEMDGAADSLPKHRLKRASVGAKAALEEEMRALKSEMEALREDIFEITETLHDLNRANREELEKAEALIDNLRMLVCAVFLMPPSLPKSVAMTPGSQLSLVIAMLQQRKEKALALSPLHPGGFSLMHLFLRDTQSDLFSRMQKAFSLVELASSSNPQEQEFYDIEKMTGGLGRWAVTHVHAELMERIWMVLRTVHGLVSAVPPLAFAELVAEITAGVPSSSSAPQPGPSRAAGRSRFAACNLQKTSHEYIQFLSRLDPLKARQVLLAERVVAAEQRNRKVAQVRVFRDQNRFVNYERLFLFRSLALRPLDLEEEIGEGLEGHDQSPGKETPTSARVATADGGDVRSDAGEAGEKARNAVSSSAASSGAVRSATARHGPPAAFASKAAWLKTALSREDLRSLQKLISGFLGIDEQFTAPVNPETHENDMYCGRFYSLAFLVEAAIKELLREVDTDYHCPWDAELLLNLISWIFAYQVTYFKAVNRLRLARRSSAPLLDRIDMIFCLQGFETALIQDYLVGLFHRAVFVLSLSRGSRPLLLSCLQCLRQLLRLLQVHVNSKKTEIVDAVKTQLASWIKRGVIGTLAHVMKTFKGSSFEADVFLYALEIVLIFASLLQAVGGRIEVVGLPRRGLGMQRRGGRSRGSLLMDDEDGPGPDGAFPGDAGDAPGLPTGSREVSVDDVVREFLRGEIVHQAMQILAHYSTNAVAVNSAVISFFELILSYKHGQPENAAFFFDVSYFLVFRNMLNDRAARTDPRVSWILNFAEDIVERFFFLWGGDDAETGRDAETGPGDGVGSDKRQDASAVGESVPREEGQASAAEGQNGNAFLPLELLFSKKKTGRAGFDNSPADVFCPTSEGSFASLFSNYRTGSDALLLAAMEEQLKTHGFVAPLDAAAECRRNLGDDLGFAGRDAANKFDKHEDELLIREFLTYRDINNWDQYIATTLGKTARAVRKRLQQLRLTNPELFPSDFSPDEDALLSSRRTSVDAGAPAASPASAVPPLLAAVQTLWERFLASRLPSEQEPPSFSRFLQSLADNFADACRLREVLRMDALSEASEAGRASGVWEAVAVEEPLEGGEAAVELLASAEFARLMQAMGAERREGRKDAGAPDEGVWRIPAEHPQEILEAAVKKLKELVALDHEELAALAAQHMQRERQRDEVRANRLKRRPFVFNSASLAEALLNFRFFLQGLEDEQARRASADVGDERGEAGFEAGRRGEGGGLFASETPAERGDGARTGEPADSVCSLSGVFRDKSADAILTDLLTVFKSLSAKLLARREAGEEPEDKERDALELRVEQFAWFACESIGESTQLRRTLAVMGCFRDFPGAQDEEGDAQILWQVPLDVDAEIFDDRVDAFANFAAKGLDELEMLVQGVRGDQVGRSRRDEDEETWDDEAVSAQASSQGRSKKHESRGGREHGKKGCSPSRRKKKDKRDKRSRPLLLTLEKLKKAAASGSGLLPEKPSTRHRYLLASKLFLWREFLESDEINRELLHGDRPLQRLLACLRQWNTERLAVLERAAEEAGDSDEEAAIVRRNRVPHLVLTACREQEEEVAFSASAAEGGEDGDMDEDAEGGERKGRPAAGEETEEAGVRFRVFRGVLPNVAAGLWVCAALGGKPVEMSENREFLWRAEERYLPASWLRKQLRILELVLLNPHMQTAAGVQVELGLIREAMEREEAQRQEEEAERQEEEERRLDENGRPAEDDAETADGRGDAGRSREQERKQKVKRREEDGMGDDQSVSADKKHEGVAKSKTSEQAVEEGGEAPEEDDFDLVPEPDEPADPTCSLSPRKETEEHSDLDEDYEMFLEPSDAALSDDALFDVWDVVGSGDEGDEPERGSRGARDEGADGADLLTCLIDDLQSFQKRRSPSAKKPSGDGQRQKKRGRETVESGAPEASERTAYEADAGDKENAVHNVAERKTRTGGDIDRVKRLMRSLDTTFAELEQVQES